MSPGFWLHHAALAWRQVFDRPPTQQEVADHAGTDRMMTFKVLQTLMDRGLVIRQPDPADGRVKHLVLTPDGGELTRRGIRIAVDLDEEMFGPGGDPLRETLQHIAARAAS